MKIRPILIAAIAICTTLTLNAQITITQSHMPVSGDTPRYSSASPIGLTFDPTQKGASQSWDFSSLKSNGQGLYEYLSANKTPYVFYFINQTGLKTADSLGVSTFTFRNIYSFYTKNSSVFKAEGIGYSFSGIPLASNYSDDDEIYQFPLDFNDSDVSTFRFVFSIPTQTQYSYVQAGKRTNVVDGWGSIKTPYKTYNSVLRVKTIMDEVDTLVTPLIKIPIPRRQVIYKWLSTTEHIPVMEITGTMAGSKFTPTQVRYRDSFLGIPPAFAPVARFDVSKNSGFVNVDTFDLTDASRPFATSWTWSVTPASDVQFVGGTTANSRNPRVVFTQRGKFTVKLTASNFLGSDDSTATDVIDIAYGAGLNDIRKLHIMFPNPAADQLHLALPDNSPVIIYDLEGRKVLEVLVKSGVIDVATLPVGMYMLRFSGKMESLQILR